MAKNSTSEICETSHGGLPITASNPPLAIMAGNSSGQWKIRFLSTTAAHSAGRASPPSVARTICQISLVVGRLSSTTPGSGSSPDLGKRKAATYISHAFLSARRFGWQSSRSHARDFAFVS